MTDFPNPKNRENQSHLGNDSEELPFRAKKVKVEDSDLSYSDQSDGGVQSTVSNKKITDFFGKASSKQGTLKLQEVLKGYPKPSEPVHVSNSNSKKIKRIITKQPNNASTSCSHDASTDSTLLLGTVNTIQEEFSGSGSSSYLKTGSIRKDIENELKEGEEQRKRLMERLELMQLKLYKKDEYIKEMDEDFKRKEAALKNEKTLLFNKMDCIKEELSQKVLQVEMAMKKERKHYLLTQKIELGEYIQQRDGNRIREVWVEGHKFRMIKEKLENISAKKAQIEEMIKNIKPKPVPKPSYDPGFFGNPHIGKYIHVEARDEQRDPDRLAADIKESKDQLQSQLQCLLMVEPLPFSIFKSL